MRLLPTAILIAVINMVCLFSLLLSFKFYNQADLSVRESYMSRYQSFLLADELRQSSDDLTRLARTYVVTGNKRYEEQYWEVVNIRNGKLNRPSNYGQIYWDFVAVSDSAKRADEDKISLHHLMKSSGFSQHEFDLLKQAQNNSDNLINLETQAMNAVKGLYANSDGEYTVKGKADMALARNLMHSADYHKYKADIMGPINDFFVALDRRTASNVSQHEKTASKHQYLMYTAFILFVIAFISTFYFIYFRIVRSAKSLSKNLKSLSRNKFDIEIGEVTRKDEFGDMSRAALTFKEAMQKTTEQNWIKTQANLISQALQKVDSISDGIKEIMSILVPLLRGGHGAFYSYDDESKSLLLTGTYALLNRKRLNNKLEIGQGLVGQCALEQKTIILANAPQDYAVIGSGTGEGKPVTVSVFPLIQNSRLHGVLEVASFHELKEVEQQLLDSVLPMICLYLDNIDRSQKTSLLLQQTQQQAEELKASEEELRLQSEELHANNDELQEKSELLEQKSSALQASEEEMRLANEVLESKTHALEKQHIKLEKSKLEVEEYSKNLEQANEYKSKFVANMSHELRTPLNSLLILANNMATNASGNMSKDDMYSAKVINESGHNLLDLINNILDLSKIDAGKMELIFDDLSSFEIKENISKFFSHVAEEKDLILNVDLSDDFPEIIRTDSIRLDQILNNLISNAIKFTQKGQVDVKFFVAKDKQAPNLSSNLSETVLAISVTDTGIGVAEDKLHSIFEAFQQADSGTSRKYGGTGLGLTITKTLVTMLGGSLDVSSVVGSGTVFTLYLPLKIDESEHIVSDIAPVRLMQSSHETEVNNNTLGAESSVEVNKNAKKSDSTEDQVSAEAPLSKAPFTDDRGILSTDDKVILVVEDDEVFAKIQYDQVHQNGLKCIVASNGEDGLRLAYKYKPVGVMLDVNMPGVDGWHVLTEIKSSAELKNIPVQMVSAVEDCGQSKKLGAIGYLTKPVSAQKIDLALAAIVKKSESGKHKILLIANEAVLDDAILDTLMVTGAEIIIESEILSIVNLIKHENIDCMILCEDLTKKRTLKLLDEINGLDETVPPLIVYSDSQVSSEVNDKIREYTENIIIKGSRSKERLQSEIELFFHSIKKQYPETVLENSEQPEFEKLMEKKVLLVDDDMRNVFALSKTLKDHKMKVIMAKDGEKALDRLMQNPDIDVILMDIMMPGMHGYDALESIRGIDKYRDLPIIAVTAKSGRAEREKCIKAGASEYLSKPVDVAMLLEKIDMLLKP